MRSLPVVTTLVLAGLALPAHAGKDPFAFFADGASAIEIEGDGEVPLLRGVDTDARFAVLAQGEDKDEPDEFVLHVRMLAGDNHCTEAVAKALGGEIEEYTVAKNKKGGLLSATVKTTTKGASIPELRIKGDNGQVVIKDWHCEIHKKDNALSIPTLDEAVVAMLSDKGVFAFAKPELGGKLMAKVGPAIPALRVEGGPYYYEGREVARLGTDLIVDGTLFGQPAKLALLNEGTNSMVAGPIVQPKLTTQRGGAMRAIGGVSVGEVSVRERMELAILDRVQYQILGETPADDIQVHAAIAATDYADVSIAVDPANNKVAFAKVEAATWKDSSGKFLEDAKEAFDKKADGGDAGSASLLVPATGNRVASLDVAPTCEPVAVVDNSYQSIDGVRVFGASAQQVTMNDCDPAQSVLRAEEDADADGGGNPNRGAAEGSADDAGEGTVDKKEARRLADYADVLWKNGRMDEAVDLYDKARALAGEDCSYHEDYARKALALGRTDSALEAAQRAAELYEPWAAQDISVRIAVQEKREVPAGTITTPQSHSCHRARGYEAMASLAKGSHKRIESLHDEHMDLDEQLPMALSLSRLQRGQVSRARGPAIEALNVGARGTVQGHLVHGIAASRAGSDRLIDANLDRILATSHVLRTPDLLVGVAMARESSDPGQVEAFTARAVLERPDDASSWIVHGLEARRRGDAAALAQVKAVAAEVARDAIDSTAGLGWAYCEAASLHYVIGDEAGGDAYLAKSKERPTRGASCVLAGGMKSVLAGDAQATANVLNDLAVRFPLQPLGTLNLVSALPAE